MLHLQDTRSDEEVFRVLQERARNVDTMAAEARAHLEARNGKPLTKVKTDAPLSLTGQWGGEQA